MKFCFDFEDDPYRVRDRIVTYVKKVLRYPNKRFHFEACHVIKFDDCDKACMIYDTLSEKLGYLGPSSLLPFQVKPDPSWFIAFTTEGTPFKPLKDKLYESCTLYDGRHVLFPSNSYRRILRDIITSAWFLRDTQLRCHISPENIYIEDYDGIRGLTVYARFLRFDMRGHLIDDRRKVRGQLRKLFVEINDKCNVDGGPKAEFDLFMKNFTLDHPLEMYNNVFFWKKSKRMNFIHRILELSQSENIVVYGDETKDAFDEDWESKLRSHPDIPLFLHLNRHYSKPNSFGNTEGALDASMKKCLETIRDLYFNFEHFKQFLVVVGAKPILQEADQFVEYVHYIFPYLIVALAKRASAMKWPLKMYFGPKRVGRFFLKKNELERHFFC